LIHGPPTFYLSGRHIPKAMVPEACAVKEAHTQNHIVLWPQEQPQTALQQLHEMEHHTHRKTRPIAHPHNASPHLSSCSFELSFGTFLNAFHQLSLRESF